METDSPAESLARLRQRIAGIERKWVGAAPRAHPSGAFSGVLEQARTPASHQAIEEILSGEVLENEAGACFHTARNYAFHRRHGNAEISAIAESHAGPLGIVRPPQHWAFLDTETTGLAGGTGTYAFLIGIGEVAASGFCVHQFFMRDFSEEPALLAAVENFLARFDVLVTYNGKAFDAPLLETRYRMARRRVPHQRLEHLDLLHAARRLWKLRLKSCRLVELETAVLGFERQGDLPGELIPYYYFDFLRTHDALRLVPVFHHNRMDILTLGCLTALVLAALGEPSRAPLAHPVDLYSLAAWVARIGKRESALELYARALRAGLPQAVEERALWEKAALHKRGRDYTAAVALWQELDTPEALEELAKYYEHRARDFSAALHAAREALMRTGSAEQAAQLRKREARLERRAVGQALLPVIRTQQPGGPA